MAEFPIQRVVFPADRHLQPLYYRLDFAGDGWKPEPEFPDRFSVRIGRGTKLLTDTYFNSFFEAYWRRYTRLGRLRLRLRLSGEGSVLLVRRSAAEGVTVRGAVNFDGQNVEVALDAPDLRLNFSELGSLHFDVLARSETVTLHGGEWLAVDAVPAEVRLVAGYCTFHREPFLLANVAALLGDPGLGRVLDRVVVVDQGSRRVRDHAGFRDLPACATDRLKLVEQPNFGGAGGFTRSILEARDTPGATHAILMDDDAVVEPESAFRAAAFLALANGDECVGGPMLDMLRPLEVYEAGSVVRPLALGVDTPVRHLRADQPHALDRFRAVERTQYNGWWFFALPLRLVDRVGLPLPVFIRGDDVEYGCRLAAAGAPTVTVPGLGVWHEPFYLKAGGWQSYYDLRNMLVLTGLRFGTTARQVRRAFLKRLLSRLLAHEYDQALLLCLAVEDFLRGPDLLAGDPRAVHARVVAAAGAGGHAAGPGGESPAPHAVRAPAGRLRWAWRVARLVRHQLGRRSPAAGAPADLVVRDPDAWWWSVGLSDVAAVVEWHRDRPRVLRRDRRRLLQLLRRGLRAAARLSRGHAGVLDAWRAEFPRLTSEAFWRDYLGAAVAPAGPADPVQFGEARAPRADAAPAAPGAA